MEFPFLYHGRMHIEVLASCDSLSKPFSLQVNNSLKSRGASHVQGEYARDTLIITKHQAS